MPAEGHWPRTPPGGRARGGAEAGRGPQESPTLGRPLFSKTRTKGVSTGAKKVTYGHVPTLPGRRTDFVTRFPEWRCRQMRQGPPDSSQALSVGAAQSLSSLKTARDWNHPSSPGSHSTFHYHRTRVRLQWINSKLRWKWKSILKIPQLNSLLIHSLILTGLMDESGLICNM